MHAAVAKALDSLESAPRRGLALALTLAVLLRLPFLDAPLQSDEGGFLMVAGQWTGGGSSLYGDQWVDRPPLLLVIFRLATVVGDSAVTLRVLALLFGLITVLAAWWAGRLINGARGGLAAAVVAAAISSSFSFAGFALTGEGIAVAFVMVSCALTLQATYDGRTSSEGLDPPDRQRSLGRGGARALLLAASAGMLAAMAFLVKQNFIDAGLFAAVVFAAAVRTNWRLLAAGAAGLLLPLVTTVVWADSDEGPGLVKLWHAVFWFRVRAVEVIHSAADSMPLDRLAGVLALFVVTGLAVLTWQLFAAVRRADGPLRLKLALLAMFGYAVFSVVAGGSWWTHYLLQFGPVLAMGTALATRRSFARLWPQLAAAVVTAASVVGCLVGVGQVATAQVEGTRDEIVGTYLRSASMPGDSVVLAYGAPAIIEISGLSTPYKYAWSLPIRARDPRLVHLVATLRGDSAPTWLVEIGDFDWWGIDTKAFQRVRTERYHVVSTVCGHNIYLRDGLVRPLPPAPSCPS